MQRLRVGGVTPLTTIDYPGELAAVVFCQGCPWRCRYCHNADLIHAVGDAPTTWKDVLTFLRRRRGLLDAVVFSGGEPTAQRALPDAVRQVRELGYKVGLHSAGCYPGRLARVLGLVDWVGLDIKALPEDYPALTGVPDSGVRAFESLAYLQESGVAFEVRITVHATLLPRTRLECLLNRLEKSGVRCVMLQRCRDERMLDTSLGINPAPSLDADRCRIGEWRNAWSEGYA
ncbi:MAG TPA: anaerobic ribonucleoside-triphosphate reductase activating protein [Gammaproteobacteria bacterium]|nr:anaerobic ribonucleoside-triphosphate reductase activating protein [Gammaproteobacteria bacterium]MCW5585175.1 anaerobic ribonucleoside-triphosphate reductase activating protein [Chromatiales bacterium]HOP17675.1 anaerobic ribonucleoside-triphosphate reductase activating protein [Gammaproteobacteria bacterium]HPQ25080.1 anaerobic ribonucleoside-triphosphate reductase activating protein [Gammaproteobacteria bacterium]